MDDWRVAPLAVESVYARAFADERRFPRGSVEFDSALLMRDRAHAWERAPTIDAHAAACLT
jgi:hypothetical protein